jgi:putative RNA 2'-phosphotransferase
VTEKDIIRTSKFLSLVLRHEPERVGLKLDHAGWVNVDELLATLNRHGVSLTLEQLRHIVATSDKKRFAFNDDETRIRASQGHSIDVELQYAPQVPPALLYHGTATRFLDSIRDKGLLKMERHHVHLSAETVVTVQVGARHGKPALLIIRAGEMHRAGHVFYRSANGVWLVEHVPPQFIEFPNHDEGPAQRTWKGIDT